MNRVDEQSWRLRVDAKRHGGQQPQADSSPTAEPQAYTCDRCGSAMFELNCKVICPSCGSRFDCSDLNIYFNQQAD